MKIKKTALILVLGLLLFGIPLNAQALKSEESSRPTAGLAKGHELPEALEQAQLEGFRDELAVYFQALRPLAQMMVEDTIGNSNLLGTALSNLAQIDEVQNNLSRLTPIDLYMLRETIARNANWRETPHLLSSLYRPEMREKLKLIVRTSAIQKSKSGSLPAFELQTGPCSVPSSGDLTQIGVQISKAVELAAEIAKEYVPSDTISAAAKAVVVTIWGLAKTQALIVEGILEVDAECDDANFQKKVSDFIDYFFIDTDVRVKNIEWHILNVIEPQLIEARQRAIEENVDLCRPVISVYLPWPYGRLEEVRDFVQEFIITSYYASLGPPFPDPPPAPPGLSGLYLVAQNYHTQGLNSMSATNKRYKEAFQYFCKAYAALVRASDNP